MKKILYTIFLAIALSSTSAVAQQKAFSSPNAECKLLAPNAFTPNGDGVNDFFHMSFTEKCVAPQFSLKIFDRWGRLVFEADEINTKWDGTYDGQQLKEGVYLWQAVIKWDAESQMDTDKEHKNGTLVLIR